MMQTTSLGTQRLSSPWLAEFFFAPASWPNRPQHQPRRPLTAVNIS